MSHKLIRDDRGQALRLEVDESKRRLWADLAALILEGVGWHRIEHELYERFGHVDQTGANTAAASCTVSSPRRFSGETLPAIIDRKIGHALVKSVCG